VLPVAVAPAAWVCTKHLTIAEADVEEVCFFVLFRQRLGWRPALSNGKVEGKGQLGGIKTNRGGFELNSEDPIGSFKAASGRQPAQTLAAYDNLIWLYAELGHRSWVMGSISVLMLLVSVS